MVHQLLGALETMPSPPGWYEGGPQGPKEMFERKAMAVLLTLKSYRGFTFREMSAHPEHDEWLLNTVRLQKAPAKSKLQNACARMPKSG
mgnify:CR=1 FL=1